MTDSAASRPASERVISFLAPSFSRPSRCMRWSVAQTVGAATPIFSVTRAAMTVRPSPSML